MNRTPTTAVAVPLELLKSRTIRVLTESFQEAFTAAYDEERARKDTAKRRLLTELLGADEFANPQPHEDYRPGTA
ncbi:hypothetical protein QCN29_09780 [Streptomyces sp. HNM0663]|uniref:Uncharacterized protein n=1 Tax=Streptomyces chengmaiensis TaxID=3040919 RepID=A0ABT6HKD3_9ACTN|nr:hypothetical protein [Streptomyces chengmaiensis]MDH2389075.1 hypothetical protein [Streptomyces chengmaiensis]